MAEPRPSVTRPTPLDLPAFLPYASTQLQAPYRVRVLVETQEEYVSKTEEKTKKSLKSAKSTAAVHASRTRTSSQEHSEEGSPAPAAGPAVGEVVVSAVHDAAGRLVELALSRCREIPRLLMQIVALCAPHQPLLTRLSVRRAQLPGEALHEIGKFLPLSQITEVRLDDSPVPERNYRVLLEHERLRCLSLARCGLDDEDCAALAEQLAHPRPASRGLCSLGLAANAIGDAGAAALGAALRSNRTLLHLDLAGNRVADDGARALLRSLTEFPLTYDEIVTKRRRHFDYLQRRHEVYQRCVESLTAAAHAGFADDAARGKRRPQPQAARSRGRSVAGSGAGSLGAAPCSLDAVAARAEALTNETLGPHSDPFSLEETVSRDSYVHSCGNGSLCYLNLAYNSLGPGSVAALLAVLRAQAARRAQAAAPGLLRVQLEGNPLPPAAPEYPLLDELLEHALHWKLSKQLRKGDKPKGHPPKGK